MKIIFEYIKTLSMLYEDYICMLASLPYFTISVSTLCNPYVCMLYIHPMYFYMMYV